MTTEGQPCYGSDPKFAPGGVPVYGTPPPEQLPPEVAPARIGPACSACGWEQVEEGFVDDSGVSSLGYARWIPGALQRGIFGGARRMGMPRFQIVAARCTRCSHLDLYVAGRV